MFDIGFWELAIIAVVALLVVGPERLPRVARTAGMWIGKMRGFVTSVKRDIDRELAADELKRALAKQAESTGLHEIIEETRKAVEPDQELSKRVDKAAADLLNKPESSGDGDEQNDRAATTKSDDRDG
jgi:sec-independent protein translocase protein TatB